MKHGQGLCGSFMSRESPIEVCGKVNDILVRSTDESWRRLHHTKLGWSKLLPQGRSCASGGRKQRAAGMLSRILSNENSVVR